LFTRAAERAGLTSRLLRRPLQKISNLVLPAVLLLKDGNACVLLAKNAENYTVVLPETESGEKIVSVAELQASYSGSAFFCAITASL